ncbi:putative P-loop containing nucleoside triphosphate hydrolase, leucine-rich repeat domain superfamily [Helianthus annuus]|uniref:P-loop containing nucleoside triphosphate hydrolase, leucine-rich repeat domain superfamily n=2 Tax=Helianthus annuus TaxID=4232 RepID=A0A9K3JEY0_HELAN|nr:disease resistance protein RPS2 [Helianthus annuus]KAF5813699.1 putative P-loop containing nucleoside triphosphate hydrolase, leucine-rich repeat domain superfamily [Helianthus annuus]
MDEEVVAAAVLPKAAETVWDSIQRITEASICMNDNHSRFEAKMQTLCAVRDDLKDRTLKYKSTKNRTMEDWFHRVMAVEKVVKELESRFTEKQQTSTWIHLLPRSKLSKQMATMCLEIGELVTEGHQLGDTLVHKVAERVVKVTAPDISYIPTLQGVLDKILLDLSNEDLKAVRVIGMLGAGKTTILQNLNNHEKVASMYERVIWVTVSGEENNKENLSIEMLQHVIAERLIMDTEDATDAYKVARSINKELADVKYLLLLDDVKAELDLELIGIPEGAKGSKIVMTTKYRNVRLPSCSSIEVKKLSQSESWNMFHRLLSLPNDVKGKPQLERMAHKAVSLCGGHPLMIKMAARIFKSIENHELSEISWSDGLQTLRRWPEKGNNEPMKDLLKFCCDHLDQEHKPCFLYSALYPEDTEISTEGLLECWDAESFLKGSDDAKIGGRNILRRLQNLILLEEGATGKYVRMHKLIRAAALNLLSEDRKDRYLVKTSELQQKLNGVIPKRQCVDLWTDKEWISLANNSLDNLPDAPRSTQLSTLFVQKYSKHKKISDSFFQHMPSLLVLDLYMTEIMTLPSSIRRLSSLKVLYLNGCNVLKELPGFIGQLKSLEVLDIRGSGVGKLPNQILGLTRMRRLLVSFTMSTQDNYDVLFKLSGLEELIIDVDSEMEEWCNTLIEDVVEKVSTLPKLISFQFCLNNMVIDVIQVVDDTVKIYVPNERHLRSFLETRKDFETRSFQVYIGCFMSCGPEIPEFYRYDRYLKYHYGRGENDAINIILCKVDAFELINHNDIEYLSSNVIENMDYVQGCLIQSCNNMTTIVGGYHTQNKSLLPNLERLDAIHMPKLERIWEGHVQPGSLSKLKTLVLCNCPVMTMVFCNAIVQQLRELQHLEVQDCCRVEEIVMCSQDVSSCAFPKLRALILCNMPSLRKISTRVAWTSLETLKIQDCPTLKELPFDMSSAMGLQSIEVDKDWWDDLQWSNSNVKERLARCCFFRQPT